jgi:hypothetical protein
VAYFSRHYRIRPGTPLPGRSSTRIVAGFDEFTLAVFGADNAAMQLAIIPLATDHRFRRVKQPQVFTAVLRTIPPVPPGWTCWTRSPRCFRWSGRPTPCGAW